MADRPPHALPPTRRAWRRVRALRRGLLMTVWTAFCCFVQSGLLLLPGRAKSRFARLYWAGICRLIGMRIRVIGEPIAGGGRPVVYASNHSSWLDVPVLGGRLLACFVAKEDVGRWPVVGQVARLGRTIFVSRQRGTTGRERDDMRLRLVGGDDLILFPEGTSSDGSRVLPFHSSFFAAAKPGRSKADRGLGASDEAAGEPAVPSLSPLVQPVSVVYDRLAGLPVGNARRAVFSWYGDMDLASHFWHLAQWRGMQASVLLHPPLDPDDFPTRKALSQATWQAVAEGAAQLRQNRPVGACRPGAPLRPRRFGRPARAAEARGGGADRPAAERGCAETSLDNPGASFA